MTAKARASSWDKKARVGNGDCARFPWRAAGNQLRPTHATPRALGFASPEVEAQRRHSSVVTKSAVA